jgi:predicted nucleic acid-binding protein
MILVDVNIPIHAINSASPHHEKLRTWAANLTTDAHLAAMAIQNGCELYTTDNDFARFPGLRWHNLLTQS